MDAILSSLSAEVLSLVEDQLANNDVSSDAELFEHFIQSGLDDMQAQHALSYRELYLCNIYREGFTPIRKGAQARRFNPYTRQFEQC